MPAQPPRTTRRPTGDARAAKVQLGTADQDARVAKDKRAKLEAEHGTAPLRDRKFMLNQIPSVMALMEWGASTGGDGLPAAFHVLEDIVHPDDWAEFRKFAREEHVEPDELADFINAAMEGLAGRPTVGPSGSSTG
jgi:hypothetical protein